ncbi:MAG TPA: J domain-containing protein [Nitrospiria bacterium]
MEYKDYYKILGVSKTGSDQEIKSAYRKLARQYHPDLNPGDKAAEEKFKQINEANEVLGDREKRKKYDELGSNWEQVLRDREYARQYTRPEFKWRTQEDLDLGDFFEAFFGDRSGAFRAGRSTGPSSGQDIETEIGLSLEDLSQGGKKPLRLSTSTLCPQCQGEGHIATASTEAKRGRVVTQMELCPTCRGQGEIPEVRDLVVTIPKGLTQGSRLRLAGQGGRGRAGGRSGDLYLRIKVLPHRVFRLEGHDLHADLPVLDHEAALGAKVEVPGLDGTLKLTIPPGTQSGQRLRLKGKGLSRERGVGAGDLFFYVTVRLPEKLTEAELELYRAMDRIRASRAEADPLRRRSV